MAESVEKASTTESPRWPSGCLNLGHMTDGGRKTQ